MTSAQPAGPSGSASALILDPHGHVEYELHLIDDGVQNWIITESDAGEGLRDYLDRMRFAADVEVRDASSERAVVWVPRREVDPERPTWLIPADYAGTGTTPAGSDRGGDASRYIGTRPGLLVGSQVLVERDELSVYLADAGEPVAGTWALEALRVAAGVPRPGLETDHRTIPHEVGWVGPAVHLAKGCYRGQETVARVHNMGRPPRRLVLLHLDGSDSHLPRTWRRGGVRRAGGGHGRDGGAALRVGPGLPPRCSSATCPTGSRPCWSPEPRRACRGGAGMRALVQRAAAASVHIAGEQVAAFDGPGLVVLVGVTHDDDAAKAARLAGKVYGLRIFDADRVDTCAAPGGAREVSASDAGLPLIVVSQFTLYGATAKGRRPTWDAAAPGPIAEPLVERFVAEPASPRRPGADRPLRRRHAGQPGQRRSGDAAAGGLSATPGSACCG